MLVQFREPEKAMAQFQKVLEVDPREHGRDGEHGFHVPADGRLQEGRKTGSAQRPQIDPNHPPIAHYLMTWV